MTSSGKKKKKSSRCEVALTPVARKLNMLVAGPAPLAQALKKFLTGLVDVTASSTREDLVQLAKSQAPDFIFLAVGPEFSGEDLCQQLKKNQVLSQVVLMYPESDTESAEARAGKTLCDAYLVLPMKRHLVRPLVSVLDRVGKTSQHLRALQGALDKLKNAPPVVQGILSGPDETEGVDDEFLKRFLPFEIKRSKRYRYPISMALVCVDGLSKRLLEFADPGKSKRFLQDELLAVLSTHARDTDLVIPLSDNRCLMFLSHTGLPGALIVAERVVLSVTALNTLGTCTISVGVASYDAAQEGAGSIVSFGSLLREANECLRQAQNAGGRSFRAPAMPEKPRKNRISMG
jgi:PleD family two-component response regulator